MTKPIPVSTQITSLTGLRAIAAGMVFFYHWLFDTPQSWSLVPRAIVAHGYLGVAIFFALSGFLITVRYRDALRNASGERRISYGNYLLKRFVRIYPLYLFVFLVFVALPGRPLGFAPDSSLRYFVGLTLTQAFFPPLLLSGVSTAWTLTIEELFYFFAPGLMRLLSGSTARICGCAFLVAVVSIGMAWGLSRMNPVVPDFIFGAPLTYLFTHSIFGRLPDFLVGMVAGVLFLRRRMAITPALPHKSEFTGEGNAAPSPVPTPIPMGGEGWGGGLAVYVCAALLLLSIVACELAAPLQSPALSRLAEFLVACSSAALIFSLACDVTHTNLLSRLLGSRLVAYLGKISYALYLIQLTEPCQWLYYVGIQLQYKNLTGGELGRVPNALALYLAATLISMALYHLVEMPAQRGLSRLAKLYVPGTGDQNR